MTKSLPFTTSAFQEAVRRTFSRSSYLKLLGRRCLTYIDTEGVVKSILWTRDKTKNRGLELPYIAVPNTSLMGNGNSHRPSPRHIS